MKLAIGTAQFGMNYGAFNQSGQITADHVKDILTQAKSADITVLDTATAYGDSESVLGQLKAAKSFNLVTKCPSLADEGDPVKAIHRHFSASLERLKTDHVHGYLLHRSEELRGSAGMKIWHALCELRDEGKITRIGISAYHPQEVQELVQTYPLSLVQLPANALTDWVYNSRYLELFERSGIEVHTRSLFLQGFLLAEPDNLPEYLVNWKNILVSFRNRAAELDLSPLQASLAALTTQTSIDKIVIGVDSNNQLCEILSAANHSTIPVDAFQDIATNDQGLIDPRLWKM